MRVYYDQQAIATQLNRQRGRKGSQVWGLDWAQETEFGLKNGLRRNAILAITDWTWPTTAEARRWNEGAYEEELPNERNSPASSVYKWQLRE